MKISEERTFISKGEYYKKLTLTADEIIITNRLKQMKMSGMAETFEEQIMNPNSDLIGFHVRFSNIVNSEWELRLNKKFNRFLKKQLLDIHRRHLMIPSMNQIGMIDTETIEQLATCKLLDEGRNLLITGATGADKSYISNALCITAIRQFKTVKYIRANTMMSEMDQARIKGTYLDYVNDMAKLDLLVIDDFGLMDLDLACLDRIIHKAFRLELNDKNMRNPS